MCTKIAASMYNNGEPIEKWEMFNVKEPETSEDGKSYHHDGDPSIEGIIIGNRYFIVNMGDEVEHVAFDLNDKSHHSEVIHICRITKYPFPQKVLDMAIDA